jgi:CubicO group peptidase (beta-lactamase class C family)
MMIQPIRLAQALGLLTLALATHAAAQDVQPTRTDALAGLDAAIASGIEQGLYPGATCVAGRVTDDGYDLLWAQAYGTTTFDPEDAAYAEVGLETLYDLASVTKLVGTTSASLIILGDGQASLEDPVSDYISGFDANGKRGVTIHHLMTHTSGLKAYESYTRVEEAREEDEPACDALIRHYAQLGLSYPTGEDYTYSCLNFQTLARVNESAADRTLESLLRERVFDPLGMDDTTWRPTTEQLARTAPTHRDGSGRPVSGTVHDPLARYHGSSTHCPGNAGLYSTAPDLARWCRMILQHGAWDGGQVLEADLVALATSVQTDPAVGELRGLGFDVYESSAYIRDANREPGHHLVGHTGYTGTMVLIDQDTGVFLVLLTNRTFPVDPDASDQTPSITDVRKQCWAIVRDYAAANR